MTEKNIKPTGLDWVQLEKDMDKTVFTETTWQRIKRKCLENPFVPFGAAITVGALTYGVINLYRGEKVMQQRMMRLRVGAQFFTIVAAITGVMLTLPPGKRNIVELVKSGQKKD